MTCRFSKRVLLIQGYDQLDVPAWAHKFLNKLLNCDWGFAKCRYIRLQPKVHVANVDNNVRSPEVKLLRSATSLQDGWPVRTNESNGGASLLPGTEPRQDTRLDMHTFSASLRIQRLGLKPRVCRPLAFTIDYDRVKLRTWQMHYL